MQEDGVRRPQLGKVPARKSPLKRMNRFARKADRSVRTFLRFVALLAVLLAVIVYWNFGTLSPCGVLREAIRERGDLVAIFPDGVIDLAFETQFGEMSAKRCFAVLLEATTGQASQLSMQPSAPRQGKQKSSRAAADADDPETQRQSFRGLDRSDRAR